MCFSAQASFIVGSGLILLSSYTIFKAKTVKLKILASGPFFFGIQQILEGLVWITLNNGDTTSDMHKYGVYGFLFFDMCFWPYFIPSTSGILEPNRIRKLLLFMCDIVGTAFALTALFLLFNYGATASIGNNHIVYNTPGVAILQTKLGLPFDISIAGLIIYLYATVLPFFISSIKGMWMIGLAIAIGFIVSMLKFYLAFGSVWCFFAALASILIYYVVMQANKLS